MTLFSALKNAEDQTGTSNTKILNIPFSMTKGVHSKISRIQGLKSNINGIKYFYQILSYF